MSERQWQVRGRIIVLLGIVALWGQRAALAEDAIEAQMRKDITYLASDELEGRGVTTKGINLAADFIASEFQKAGLKPAGADGTYFSAPCYPLDEVIDPTGAGDAFAGGLLGYLSTVEPGPDGCYSIDDLKRGVVHGNILGSFVCEDFSIGRLRALTMDDIAERYRAIVACSHFDPDWWPRQVVIKHIS